MSTKEQLIAQVNALNADIAALQAKHDEIEQINLRLCAELTAVTEVASAINTARKDRPGYVMPAWQVERQQQMAAAKAAAMAHHCVVKV